MWGADQTSGMDKIQTGDNLVIELEQGLWRLSSGRPGERPLLVASIGAPSLAYRPIFAQARRLPTNGGLPIADIEKVVVGWARADRAWHLGLLLREEAADARGGRWCELAQWPDDYAQLAADRAQKAGASLAQVIRRPFQFIQAPRMTPAAHPQAPHTPRPSSPSWSSESPARPAWSASQGIPQTSAFPQPDSGHIAPEHPTTMPAARTRIVTPVLRVGRKSQAAFIALPVTMADWTLRAVSVGLEWAHSRAWSLRAVGRVFFNVVVGVAFIVLSVLTLQSPFAPPDPFFLPYMGILIGAGMIYAALRLIFSMLRTESIVIDSEARQVRRHLDLTNDVVETYDFEEIRAVVASQVAQRRYRGRDGQPDTMSHEGWLHLLLYEPHQKPGRERRLKPEDAYVTIGYVGQVEGNIVPEHFEGKKRKRLPQWLYQEEATTPLQKAALGIARAIGTDAYIDQR